MACSRRCSGCCWGRRTWAVQAISAAPGPLALAWGFKAASTLDSMLGYRQGRLRWLGTAGARLDDLLVWLPCRLVALTLPLAAGLGPRRSWELCCRRPGGMGPRPLAQCRALPGDLRPRCCRSSWGAPIATAIRSNANPCWPAGCPPPTPPRCRPCSGSARRLELLWLRGGIGAGLGDRLTADGRLSRRPGPWAAAPHRSCAT